MATDVNTVLRVLVALDPADPRSEALDAIGSLGEAETVLEGLFVEDARILQLARVPIAREVTLTSADVRALDVSALERQLRAQALTVRRAFETAASRLGVPHSFRIARGEVVAELTESARRCDVLIIGRAPRQDRQRSWLGQAIHAVGRHPPRTIVFVQGTWQRGRSVVVLPDALDSRSRALETAARIALRDRLDLTVLASKGNELPAGLRQHLGLEHSRIRCLSVASLDAGALIDIAGAQQARVMVLPAHRQELEGEGIIKLLDELEASLALTRESD